jgi:RNA polymerase sigma factor (sigma-70 family)
VLEDNLRRIFLESRPALHRYLTQKTHCPDAAADLVQEVYLRLPQLKPVPASEPLIRAWLFRVGTNMAIDHFRKIKRHSDLLCEYAEDMTGDNSPVSPEQAVLNQDQITHLQKTLETLPTVCTEVLYLSRIEGLTHQAIAESLGISKSWVEKQLVRALDHCRKVMDDD